MITHATPCLPTSSPSTSSIRTLPPGARAGVELTLETAKALHAALAKAIAEAEIEEAERAEGIAQARLRAKAPVMVELAAA